MAKQTAELATHQEPTVLQAIKAAKPQFEGRLPKSLPSGMTPEKFMLGVATAVQKNPALLECDPKSVLLAAYEAAELGINLSPTLQLGYLIPYAKQAQFQLSYRGMIQKGYESGAIRNFFAEVVYEKDGFTRQLAPKRNLFHAPGDGDRGQPIGAYALVEFKTGNIEFEYLTAEQIQRHRKHSKQPDSLMWVKFWEEGWRKTPIRVLSKRLPMTNPELETLAEAIARDAENDLETEPTGALQLESDSQLHTVPKAVIPPEPKAEPAPAAGIFVQVGKALTVITGSTYVIKEDLPKVGAKWDGKARIWTMPAPRTHELLAICEKKKVGVTEVDDNGRPVGEAPMREPGDEDESQLKFED
jgi:recombination protein RecT